MPPVPYHRGGIKVSVHPSLKIASGSAKHKNVLTKKERMQRLQDSGQWSDDSTLYSMRKIGKDRKSVV